MELEGLIKRIPKHMEHPNSELIITIPSSSAVSPTDVSEIVAKYAVPKGWGSEEVRMNQRAGYFSCNSCGKTFHIHIKSPPFSKCPNCGSNNFRITELEISFKSKN